MRWSFPVFQRRHDQGIGLAVRDSDLPSVALNEEEAAWLNLSWKGKDRDLIVVSVTREILLSFKVEDDAWTKTWQCWIMMILTSWTASLQAKNSKIPRCLMYGRQYLIWSTHILDTGILCFAISMSPLTFETLVEVPRSWIFLRFGIIVSSVCGKCKLSTGRSNLLVAFPIGKALDAGYFDRLTLQHSSTPPLLRHFCQL